MNPYISISDSTTNIGLYLLYHVIKTSREILLKRISDYAALFCNHLPNPPVSVRVKAKPLLWPTRTQVICTVPPSLSPYPTAFLPPALTLPHSSAHSICTGVLVYFQIHQALHRLFSRPGILLLQISMWLIPFMALFKHRNIISPSLPILFKIAHAKHPLHCLSLFPAFYFLHSLCYHDTFF